MSISWQLIHYDQLVIGTWNVLLTIIMLHQFAFWQEALRRELNVSLFPSSCWYSFDYSIEDQLV